MIDLILAASLLLNPIALEAKNPRWGDCDRLSLCVAAIERDTSDTLYRGSGRRQIMRMKGAIG